MVRLVCTRPFVKLNYDVLSLTPLKENYALGLRMRAGGDGLIAARCFSALSVEYLTYLMAGGHQGDLLVGLIEEEKLCYDVTRSALPTPICTVIGENRGRTQILDKGKSPSSEDRKKYLKHIIEELVPDDITFICPAQEEDFLALGEKVKESDSYLAVMGEGSVVSSLTVLKPFLLCTTASDLYAAKAPVENIARLVKWIAEKEIDVLIYSDGKNIRCCTRSGCLEGMYNAYIEMSAVCAGFISGIIRGFDTKTAFCMALAAAYAYWRSGYTELKMGIIMEEAERIRIKEV
jgi:fructose-1-phosphate kinase PfkB-like protein